MDPCKACPAMRRFAARETKRGGKWSSVENCACSVTGSRRLTSVRSDPNHAAVLPLLLAVMIQGAPNAPPSSTNLTASSFSVLRASLLLAFSTRALISSAFNCPHFCSSAAMPSGVKTDEADPSCQTFL